MRCRRFPNETDFFRLGFPSIIYRPSFATGGGRNVARYEQAPTPGIPIGSGRVVEKYHRETNLRSGPDDKIRSRIDFARLIVPVLGPGPNDSAFISVSFLLSLSRSIDPRETHTHKKASCLSRYKFNVRLCRRLCISRPGQ